MAIKIRTEAELFTETATRDFELTPEPVAEAPSRTTELAVTAKGQVVRVLKLWGTDRATVRYANGRQGQVAASSLEML